MTRSRPDAPVPGAEDLAAAVSALVAPVFESLETLGADVLACREAAGTPCTEADLATLEKRIAPRLAAHPAAAGMGFVAAPGVIGGQERFLLWWQRAGDDLARLRLNFGRPASTCTTTCRWTGSRRRPPEVGAARSDRTSTTPAPTCMS
ncbi:MAG: hypothetical protein R2731_06640 [Nocardioides sp.]